MAVPEVFFIDNNNQDGLKGMCKDCTRQYAKQNYHKNRKSKLVTRWKEPQSFCKRCGIRFSGVIADTKRHEDLTTFCIDCGDIIKQSL